MLFENQTVNDKGHLEINGCDTVALAEEYGTPLYVMDEGMLCDKCSRYVNSFKTNYPNVDIAYASKAFTVVAMCRLIKEQGMWLDVASLGELYTGFLAGFDTDKIVFHGNFKTELELQEAAQKGIKVVCDSYAEIEQLAGISASLGKKTPVMVRCNPGINPHTHAMISTGQEDSKFGFNIKSGDAQKAIELILSYDSLEFVGVHSHLGSQLLDAEVFRQVIPVMARFFAELKNKLVIEPKILDLGGGLGVRYTEEDKPLSIEDFALLVTSGIKAAFSENNLKLPHLILEPVRSIAAEAGTTLYRTGQPKYLKLAEAPFEKTYLPVDGGLSDNPRPALYGAQYSAMIANRAGMAKDTMYTVSGRHCETDKLFPDIMLQKAEPGDILAVQSTGAYGHSMASNYNRFMRPAVVFVNNAKSRLVCRRETLDDIVKCDIF